MSESKLRNKISKFILISNAILFITIIVLYLFSGFLPDEFTTLITFISPVTAVYIGALVKFAVENKNVVEDEKTEKPVNRLYVTISYWSIPFHFFSIFIIVWLKAINLITFGDLKIAFSVIETFFGVYVGYVVSSLFKVDEGNDNKKEDEKEKEKEE
jgi:amino acid transporter